MLFHIRVYLDNKWLIMSNVIASAGMKFLAAARIFYAPKWDEGEGMQLDCLEPAVWKYILVCSFFFFPVNLVVVPNLHWLLLTNDSHFMKPTIFTNYMNSDAQPTSGLSEVVARSLTDLNADNAAIRQSLGGHSTAELWLLLGWSVLVVFWLLRGNICSRNWRGWTQIDVRTEIDFSFCVRYADRVRVSPAFFFSLCGSF